LKLDPSTVIDQFDASMVEQLAAIKLRGFVDGVGGEVLQCDAGLIKVRLARVVETAPKKRFWGLVTVPGDPEIDWIPLELHMAKHEDAQRSLVEITVVRPDALNESPEQAKIRQEFCEQICRELRAYLMVER
jgi:hypothetical protein